MALNTPSHALNWVHASSHPGRAARASPGGCQLRLWAWQVSSDITQALTPLLATGTLALLAAGSFHGVAPVAALLPVVPLHGSPDSACDPQPIQADSLACAGCIPGAGGQAKS